MIYNYKTLRQVQITEEKKPFIQTFNIQNKTRIFRYCKHSYKMATYKYNTKNNIKLDRLNVRQGYLRWEENPKQNL